MSIDKELTLLNIKKRYGSINAFLNVIPGTRALFYQALSLKRDLVFQDSKTAKILEKLEADGLLIKTTSEISKQLNHNYGHCQGVSGDN